MNILLFKFLVTFVMGSFLMVLLSFTIYRRSYYYMKAKEQINPTSKKPGILSRLVTVMILLMMVVFLSLFNLWLLLDTPYSFGYLFLITLILIFCISLFDALFIDYFMLLKWRPKLLKLPEGQPTKTYMISHIKKQFTFGWIFKIIIAILAVAFSSIVNQW